MAERVLFEFVVDSDEAVNKIIGFRKEIANLKQAKKETENELKKNPGSDLLQRKLYDIEKNLENTTQAMRSYKQEVQRMEKIQKANEGSLTQLREQLKLLNAEYVALSREDRESPFGQAKRDEIAQMTEYLKQQEHAIGDSRRNVGNYKDDIIAAATEMDGSVRNALRQIREELTKMNVTWETMPERIEAARAKMQQVASVSGIDSEEYRRAADEVSDLEVEYKNLGDRIEETSQKAGVLQDAVTKSSNQLRNLGEGARGVMALRDGAQVLLDSYTALATTMQALGISQEEWIELMAKLEVLQRTINGLTQVYLALEDDSLLVLTAKEKWGKLRNIYTEAYNKSLERQNIVIGVNTTLTDKLRLSTIKLSAGIKTVGAALKSIPVWGWLLAAAGAIATIVSRTIKHNDEQKKLNATMRESTKIISDFSMISSDAAKNVYTQVVNMDLLVQKTKTLDSDTVGYKNTVAEIATLLGVNVGWLDKNISKVDELADAWVKVKLTEAVSEEASKQYAETRVQLETIQSQIRDIYFESGNKGDFVENLRGKFQISSQDAKQIYRAADALFSAAPGMPLGDLSRHLENSLSVIVEFLQNKAKSSLEVVKKTIQDTSEAVEELNLFTDGQYMNGNANTTDVETQVNILNIRRQIQEATIALMEEGLEKEIAASKFASEQKIANYEAELKKYPHLEKEYGELIQLEKDRQKNEEAKIRKKYQDAEIAALEEFNKKFNETAISRELELLEQRYNIQGVEAEKEYMQEKLRLTLEELDRQMSAEIANTQLTEEQKQQIREYYIEKRKLTEEEFALWLKNKNTETQNEIIKKEQERISTNLQATASVSNAMTSLLQQVADNNEEMSGFMKGVALANIAIQTASSIASAVSGATQSGAGTGVAAIVTTPAFIATLVTTVLSAIGQAASILGSTSIPSAPKFSTGGLVEGEGTATSDSIPAFLSNGESVMTAAATATYGPMLSAMNQSVGGSAIGKGGDMRVIREMFRSIFAEMPAPEVSVREITSVSNKVKVKESIRRR